MSEERQMVKIIREICSENMIDYKSFSYDWILQLSCNSHKMFIYGYKFPNNNASIEQICNDKSALSDVLRANNIPCVEHEFFMSPNNSTYTGINGDWERMTNILRKYGKVVCKANTGTGGKNVYKVESQKDLEVAVHRVFSKSNSLCIAPYKDIKSEYRVIVVNSSIGVIYEKRRPYIIGDGNGSIRQLIEANREFDEVEISDDLDLDYVPNIHEHIDISWKHNLGQGATPVLVNDDKLKQKLTALALSCAMAIDIDFASIDIIKTDSGLEILEVNSGIMMENLAKSSENNYCVAKEIYKKAIFHYLKMDEPKYKYLVQKPIKQHFVLPVLETIAKERGVDIIPDKEEGNFSIFVFGNGKRFIARDYPFNINYAGSISLCTNKAACTSFLDTMGFNVPKQKYFVKKTNTEITISELKKVFSNPLDTLGFDFPMIIKPNSLSQGVGVFKVDSPEEGILAAKKVMSLKEKIFLVQEYCSGHDYRIVVLNGEVIQAYERIPFHIVGNGKDSIWELLMSQVTLFEAAGRDKVVDPYDERIINKVHSQGYELNTVLDKGAVCVLQDIANLSLGGTTEDKLSNISPFYKQLAINIGNSLNLKLCGIDIIAKDITDCSNNDYFVLEVNSAPGLDNYAYSGQEQEEYVLDLYRKVFDFLESV